MYNEALTKLTHYDHQLLARYYYTLNETVALDQVNLELRVMNLALQKSYDAVLVSKTNEQTTYESLLVENNKLEILLRTMESTAKSS